MTKLERFFSTALQYRYNVVQEVTIQTILQYLPNTSNKQCFVLCSLQICRVRLEANQLQASILPIITANRKLLEVPSIPSAIESKC